MPRAASWNSEGEGGFLDWNSEEIGGGGGNAVWNSKHMAGSEINFFLR